MAFWVLSGGKENWRVALQQGGIWGVRQQFEGVWRGLQKGDVAILYVTDPVKGIIGFGKIRDKFIQDRPLWPDEESKGKVLYPFRFDFDVEYVLPTEDWEEKRISGRDTGFTRTEIGTGLNALSRPDLRERVQLIIAERFERVIAATPETPLASPEKQDAELNHDRVQSLLFEIGRLNRFISEKEYKMNGERLDCVWRRIEKSVPTYVFEVQIGGDIYHALGKLKHAHDLWNSNVFLVLTRADVAAADRLLNGTFREVNSRLRKLFTDDVRELFERKSRWQELERKLGLQ